MLQFVVVHQNLLQVVIGKSGLLQGIFLGPVAAVLRSLEGVVDVSDLFKHLVPLTTNADKQLIDSRFRHHRLCSRLRRQGHLAEEQLGRDPWQGHLCLHSCRHPRPQLVLLDHCRRAVLTDPGDFRHREVGHDE